MITNDRQYRITKSQLRGFRKSLDSFDLESETRRLGSPLLAQASVDALRSECEVLSDQIEEYEALKAGEISTLEVENLEGLPLLLIKARVARGMSQRKLAEALGLKEQQIQRYEAERYATASLDRLSAVARALKLDIAGLAELSDHSESEPLEEQLQKLCSDFPIKEMFRRGWLTEFTSSLSAAMAHHEDLARQFVRNAMPRQQPALLRQRARADSRMNQSALLAWQCRVLLLARQTGAMPDFSRRVMTDDWFTSLIQESRFEDGPLRAKRFIRDSGISLVIEPHLTQTFLDGAAFLLPSGQPVIGLTLRYDRLDNFWFVLIHELIHIRDHLRKSGLRDIFDDLELNGDEMERETDRVAGELLIPQKTWETALARYVHTDEAVRLLANELAIHPAIVAGRIRHETNNYMILREMTGHGKVRALFPDAPFAG